MKFQYIEEDPFIEIDYFEDPIQPKYITCVVFNRDMNFEKISCDPIENIYRPARNKYSYPIFTTNENAEFLLKSSSNGEDLSKKDPIMEDIANRLIKRDRIPFYLLL